MSWPQILIIFVVGFVCGAVWMRARCRHMFNRRAVFFESIQGAASGALQDEKELTPTGSSRRDTGGQP